MNFDIDIKNKIDLIDNRLDELLKAAYPEKIYEAMNYSVKAGGKRLRPILNLLSCECFGGDINDTLDFACALEMIHTYSLIHDDLPAMDDDDYRRGNLTCHKKFDEATAILAGDGLLNFAFETMISKTKNSFEKRYLEALDYISHCSGVRGMIGGQVADMEAENKVSTENELLYIHKNKTAKLIQASLVSGAIIANANDKDIEIIEKIGEIMGIAFQIQDDILDVTSTTEDLGKPVLSDEKNKKTTYVSLFGLEKSKIDFENMYNELFDLLDKTNSKNTDTLKYYFSLMNKRNK